MARENEIKILLKIDLDTFTKRIENKGFHLNHTLIQTDTYFDTDNWYLYENIGALRLRQINNKEESFSFKKVFCLPKKKDYYVEEIEVKYPFEDYPKLKEISNRVGIPFKKDAYIDKRTLSKYLSSHNFYDEQKMQKTRSVYLKGEDEVVIDDVDRVGIIVELECLKNDPMQVIKTILKNKEWERSLEGTSYIWLKNVKGLTSHLTNIKRFAEEPDWNVWKNERKWYNKINDSK
jgi:adenylate cyclase class IV